MSDKPRTYTLAELRAMSSEQRAALMPAANAALGLLLATVADRVGTKGRAA
jgi:hypothetical protein